MIINYKFDGEFFDYKIEDSEYDKAILKILNGESKESLIEILMDADFCSINLFSMYKDELKDYFEDKAYKEYLDGRYE